MNVSTSVKALLPKIRMVISVWAFARVSLAWGQVGLPHMEQIYGGTIRRLVATATSATATRLYVIAEGPRGIFYADVDHAQPAWADKFGGWQIVPDFESYRNHGVANDLDIHGGSGWLFVADPDEGLLRCTTAAATVATVLPGSFGTVQIIGDRLLAVGSDGGGNLLHFGTVDASGAYTADAGSPLACPVGGDDVALSVDPVGGRLYVMAGQDATCIWESSDRYDALSGTTAFASWAFPPEMAAFTRLTRLGFGPDGTLFVGNSDSNATNIWMAASADLGRTYSVTSVPVPNAGSTRGLRFATSGPASGYTVYFGELVNRSGGAPGAWVKLGTDLPPTAWPETRSNAGCVAVDPNDASIVYATSDGGTGVSLDAGITLQENNDGLTATQVYDIDLLPSKAMVWICAKSGVWYCPDFASGATWTYAGFLAADGGAQSVAMSRTSPGYLDAYVGSRRVWHTPDGGATWSRVYTALAEDGVTNGLSDGWVNALAVDEPRVFAGYHGHAYTNEAAGHLAWTDGASPWGVFSNSLDVTDIVIVGGGGTGTGTVFVAAAWYTNNTAYGIYRLDAGAARLEREFAEPVHVTDLCEGSGGEVFAVGLADAGIRPRVYRRDGGAWTPVTTNGLPALPAPELFDFGWRGPCLTVGVHPGGTNALYVGLQSQIYYLLEGAAAWATTASMSYPNGAQIHCIAWDDLLVGTSYGLVAQDVDSDADGLSDRDELDAYFTNPAVPDSDGDGLSDGDEIRDAQTDPNRFDTDGDRVGDGSEVIARTDPLDSGSVLQLTGLGPAPAGKIELAWSSEPGVLYKVLRSASLAGPWSPLLRNLPATPPQNHVQVVPPPGSGAFFRIGVETVK